MRNTCLIGRMKPCGLTDFVELGGDMNANEFVILGLVGGDSDAADWALAIDLDRGNAGEDWSALVRADLVGDFLSATGATEVSRRTWDGSRFGDSVSSAEFVDGSLVCR